LVENFPGFAQGIQGPELMSAMMQQAEHCGATVMYEAAAQIRVEPRPIQVALSDGSMLKTHTLIFATGAKPRDLGVKGEAEYSPPQGSGVTACAVCDGAFYRGKDVCVVGGGDSAMEEATYLAKLCRSVTVIHRREGFRASNTMVARAKANPLIRWELNQVVDEIVGDSKAVSSVRLKDVRSGTLKDLSVAAVFSAIGHMPNTKLLKGLVKLDPEGYIVINEHMQTSESRIFAAGDCHDRRYRQAVTAAALGCMAALAVERFLTQEGLA
jgi:thioredoxin reductase (NADPH)